MCSSRASRLPPRSCSSRSKSASGSQFHPRRHRAIGRVASRGLPEPMKSGLLRGFSWGMGRPRRFRPGIGQGEASEVGLAVGLDAGPLAGAPAPERLFADDAAEAVETIATEPRAERAAVIVSGLGKPAAAFATVDSLVDGQGGSPGGDRGDLRRGVGRTMKQPFWSILSAPACARHARPGFSLCGGLLCAA